MRIDAARLHGKTLMLKRIGADDYAVTIASLTAGRIMAKPVSFGRVVWFWSITGPYLAPAQQPGHGETGGLEAAKGCFKAAFDKWQHGAGADAAWHG